MMVLAVGMGDHHLGGVEGVLAELLAQPLLLAHGVQAQRPQAQVVQEQVHPMDAHIGEGIALLDPLEGPGGDLQRLLQHPARVQRRAHLRNQLSEDAEVVGIVALVHVRRDHQAPFARLPDDGVRLARSRHMGFS